MSLRLIIAFPAGAPAIPSYFKTAIYVHGGAAALQWYAHWIPRGEKRFVDTLDEAAAEGRHQFGTISKDLEMMPAQLPEKIGEPWRSRTSNLLIKSQLLCQLS